MAVTLKDLYGGLLTVQNEMNLYRNLPEHKKKFEMLERIVADLELALTFPFMGCQNFVQRVNWLTKQGCSEMLAALVLQLKTSANVIAYRTRSDIGFSDSEDYESIEHSLGVVCWALRDIIREQTLSEITKPT